MVNSKINQPIAAKQNLNFKTLKQLDSEISKWRETQAEFVAVVEEWKALPRVNKGTESKLWKRISTARSTFEKNRRTHFADRKKQAAESQQAKKELIKQAEQLDVS